MVPPTEIETRRLEELIQAVEELRRRVAALEQHSIAPAVSTTPEASLAPPSAPLGDSTTILAALGRLLLGIAGAYLLRAITEAALLPQTAGTIAGLLYAGAWLVSAGRLAAGNRIATGFQSLTAALIAGPLLWEATVRFHSLSPSGAAAALALFIVCGQTVAWRRHLTVVAGVAALAGSITALILIIATLNPVPYAIALSIAAAVIEYAAIRDRALALRWIIAAAVDFCAFLIIYVATRPQGLPDGYAPIPVEFVVAIPIALVGIYLTSIVTRTLARGLAISGFEIAQAVVSIALAIGCGLQLAHGKAIVLMGSLCLAAGAGGYLAALLARTMPRRNVYAYATFAILLIAAGGFIGFPTLVRTSLWSALALAATAFGERTRSNTFRFHGALYLIAAAGTSGMLTDSAARLFGASGESWPPPAAAWIATITAVIAYGLVLRLRTVRLLRWMERVPAALLAAAACWTLVGLAAGWLVNTHWDASLVNTSSTGLIAAVAIALAWFGRGRNLKELFWVLFPWMIFGALKLLAQDFRQNRPATLFVSLLLYGGTLIALPRLLRRATPVRPDLS